MSMSSSVLLCVFVFCLLAMGSVSLADAVSVPADDAVPVHEIGLDFDLQAHGIHGTSRISLPPNMAISLTLGPLQFTGGVLHRSDREGLPLTPAQPANMLHVPASPTAQVVLLSWTLVVDAMGDDNRVDEQGITLAGLWHPLPDRDMRYRLSALLPSGFSGVTEADDIVVQAEGRGQRLTAAAPLPLRAVHLAAGPYLTRERRVEDMTLAAAFFPEDEALIDSYLDQAEVYLRRYSALIGPYPYRRFTIAANRLPTGYAMPTFTLIGQTVLRLSFLQQTSLGHEILHAWFGNSVLTPEDEGNWCEGLVTYLADQSFAVERGEGESYRKGQLLRQESYLPSDNQRTARQFAGSAGHGPAGRAENALGYDRASMVFHMLRRELGDTIFFQGLRDFYRTHRGQRAGWDELAAAFSTAAGRELTPFFRQWLDRPDMPRLTLADVALSQREGQSRITLRINQQGDAFHLRLPVQVRAIGGEKFHQVELRESETTVELISETLPLEVALDPGYDVQRGLTDEELPPAWSLFEGAASRTVILGDAGASAAYEPLRRMLERSGARVLPDAEVKNADLRQGSFLFLGPGRHSRSLFATPTHPARGCTVDTRLNPFDPRRVMVLVTSDNAVDTEALARRLRHYGKYASLHVLDGRVRDKKPGRAVDGIRRELAGLPASLPARSRTNFETMIDQLEQNRVVYVGETHTDYGHHLLQLQVIQALHARHPDLAVGLEMFPRGSQAALDDYIAGTIKDEREFLNRSRYGSVWGYDWRLYRDIVDYARRHRIPLVALNLDKRVTSRFFKDGHGDDVPPELLAQAAQERDLDLPGYRRRLQAVHGRHHMDQQKGLAGFLQAQSLWDETMAESIVKHLRAHPGRKMVVLAGNGHVLKDSGIPPRVTRRIALSQSVLMPLGSVDADEAAQADHLVSTAAIELPPSGKLGVVLEEESAGVGSRMRISQLSPHGKAGAAGLLAGDLLLTVQGIAIVSLDDVRYALMEKKAGETVEVRVRRGAQPGKELTVTVELSRPPEGRPHP